MKRFCLLFIFFVITFSDIANASSTTFTDIDTHWAKENIIDLISVNIISGYPDGSFKPENNITVSEFLKMIIVAGEYTLVRNGENIYPDFYIATAKERGLIQKNEIIDFNKFLTRYEMVDIISNFVGVDDVKVNKNIFKDLEKDKQNNVLKLVKLKIINGYDDKTFRGENNITRAEAAVVICKALENRDALIFNRKLDNCLD